MGLPGRCGEGVRHRREIEFVLERGSHRTLEGLGAHPLLRLQEVRPEDPGEADHEPFDRLQDAPRPLILDRLPGVHEETRGGLSVALDDLAVELEGAPGTSQISFQELLLLARQVGIGEELAGGSLPEPRQAASAVARGERSHRQLEIQEVLPGALSLDPLRRDLPENAVGDGLE